MSNPNREERTLRVTLDDFEFDRVTWVAQQYECSPTMLVRECVSHVLDQLIEGLERD